MGNGKPRDDFPASDPAIERQLLGSILLEPALLDSPAIARLRPRHFLDDAHGKILHAMQELREGGKPQDVSLLIDQLKRHRTAGQSDLEVSGGVAYLSRVIGSVVTHANARYFADLVWESFHRRQLWELGREVIRQACDGLPPVDIDGWIRNCLETTDVDFSEGENAPQSIRQLRAQHGSLRPAVIHGLLREGETMNVIAAPKMGKSWLTYSLALAVVTGDLWLGKFLTVQGDVLLVDNELHSETAADRIPRVAGALGIPPEAYEDRLLVKTLRGQWMDVVEIGRYLTRFRRGQFKLVMIDALYRSLPKGTDENDNGAMAEIYNVIDGLAERLGCSFVLVHHSSKGNQSGKAVTDVGAGAGAQSRATDTHLVLRPHQDPGVVVLEAAVRSWGPISPVCLRWEFPTWTADFNLDPSRLRIDRPKRSPQASQKTTPARPSRMEQTMSKVVEALRDHGPLTKTSLKAKTHVSGTTVLEALEALLEAGEIVPCEVATSRGTYAGYRLAPCDPGPTRTTPDCPSCPTPTGHSPPSIEGGLCPVRGRRALRRNASCPGSSLMTAACCPKGARDLPSVAPVSGERVFVGCVNDASC